MSYMPYQIIFDGKAWFAWYEEPVWKSEDLNNDTEKITTG